MNLISVSLLRLVLLATPSEGALITNLSAYSLPMRVTQEKTVHLIQGRITLPHSVTLFEIEATVDSLALKLHELQFTDSFESFEPYETTAGKNVVTLFGRQTALATASKVCNSKGLSPLSLSNISPSARFNLKLPLQFEISVNDLGIVCAEPGCLLKDDACLDFILKRTAERSFFENRAFFRKHLTENYPSSTVYLAVNNSNAVLELNPVGFTGCLGKPTPGKNQTLQGLHDIFHAKLNRAYMTLISLLDTSAGKLGDAIHCLTADTYLPPAAKDERKLKAQIMALVPKYLPNHSNRQSLFPTFQDFFARVVENSHNDAISNLTNPALLDSMSVKTQQKVLTALLQFSYELKARLVALLSGLNPASNLDSLTSIL
jgi:hypothetical protein